MSQQPRPPLDPKTKLIAAWGGVILTLIATLGFIAAPGARLLWIVLLTFGILTIPQVLLWNRSNRDRGEKGGG